MKVYAARRPAAMVLAALATGFITAATVAAPAQAAPGDSFRLVAVDVGSASNRVEWGNAKPIYLLMQNASRGETGATITISLPIGAQFIDDYEDCTYSDYPTGAPVDTGMSGFVYGPTRVTCELPFVFAPGQILPLFNPVTGDSAFNLVTGRNAPGPAKLSAEFGATESEPEPELLARAAAPSGKTLAAKLASFSSASSRRAEQSDTINGKGPIHIGKGTVPFYVFTARNTIDVTVTAPALTATIGSTVTLAFVIKNLGPSDGSGPNVKLKAPSGTVFVNDGEDDPPWCHVPGTDGGPWTEATELNCSFESYFPVSQFSNPDGVRGEMPLKINSTPGTDGTVTVSGEMDGSTESNPENNVAPIVVTITGGGLPVTGANAMLIGGVGLAVVVIGGGLFLISRRRRVVPVAPSQDG